MYKVIQSCNNKYWQEKDKILLSKDYIKSLPTLFVNSNIKRQKHIGFGGAFTDAATISLHALPKEKQQEVIKAYYSCKGLNYNLGRYPIMSTDFSKNSYEYIKENDLTLSTFDISCDKNRLDFVKECLKYGDIFLMASPWSPNAFMKDNNDRLHGGHLKREYYELWAKLLVKSIIEYAKEGVNINAISIQNEPLAVQVWESCIYDAKQEAIFIRDYLHKELILNDLGDIKIIIWDHNRDLMPRRAHETLQEDGLNDIVWGIGYHWYCCDRYSNLTMTHNMYPNKHILLTECCVELVCDSTTGKSSKIGEIEHCQRYAKQIINDLNNYSEGYIDWNLCLNEVGGPNHVGNYCEAPIMIDTITKQINYMASYYYIGHFSKYIMPNATNIYSESDTNNIYITSYINPNNKKVIVILSTLNNDCDVSLVIDDLGVNIKLKANSIITLIEE